MPPRELTMPKLSDSMADAVILRWLKSAGDAFARGEGLIEVETDKATVVYEAEWDGTLDSILVPEGATVAVGEPIATLANGDGAAGRDARLRLRTRAVAPPPAAIPAAEASPLPATQPRDAPTRRRSRAGPRSSSASRSTALAGTGPGGRITVDDVTTSGSRGGDDPGSAAQAPVSGKGEVSVHEPTPTQATIARRMVESATTIPVFTVSADIDVSQIVASRREARERGRGRLRRSTTSWSRRRLPRCASSPASTPPTSTARSSATRG